MPRIAGAVTTAYVVLCLALPGLASASAGGAPASAPPKVSSVACRTECSGVAVGRPGSLLLLRGKEMDTSETVTFLGAARPGDEVSVEPERVSRTSITVRVPRGAGSGPLTVTNGDGAVSKPTVRRIRVDRVQTRAVGGDGSGPSLEVAVTGRKVFFDAERRPTLTYVVHDPAPVKVIVEIVRAADAVSIARFDQGVVPPNEQRTFAWDGLIDGVVAPDGRYEFRVYAENGSGVRASSAQAGPAAAPDKEAAASPDSFILLGHKFPIRGAHDYGEFAATFGGGRGHKGQDVFADCGTPMVAARGGTVKIKQFQERAGHYLVIDGEQTDVDYVYMHLREAALVEKGARVHTGQVIGYVGDTGRADGCHLHFELWSGPGWYTGGTAMDPLPLLKAWDRFS
jgi:murein DD-endopeptidase MepM/ murein hydrolase activator NlpD